MEWLVGVMWSDVKLARRWWALIGMVGSRVTPAL